MKKILLLFTAILLSVQSFAQDPDPELFKTWYLRNLIEDWGVNIVVDDISPHINPTLTLTETLSFYGEAACNTFTGTMSYDGATNLFEIVSFDRTLNTCNEQEHEFFEAFYFTFFEIGRSFRAYVTIESNGEQTLDTIGWYPLLIFKNFALDVPENDELNMAVFPNPVSNTLFISSENIQIEKISVYSISGKQVLDDSNFENSLDVSSLSEGIYFLEISSPEGKSIQKFIKQ